MNAHDLIAAARLLATHPRRGRPPEANLRRAAGHPSPPGAPAGSELAPGCWQ